MRVNRSRFITFTFALVIVAAVAVTSRAASPTAIDYQGRLTNSGGAPVTDGSYSVVFTVYDAAAGGTSKWTETQSVTTTNGLFAVLLGTITPITDSVFNGQTRYLGVKVGTDPEQSPRTRLVTAPYAFRISTVDGSTGGAISGNINLDPSTATTGNLLKGGLPFMHNFGDSDTFVGLNAGNLIMSGRSNTACGAAALQNNTIGTHNTAGGARALHSNTSGQSNTAIGFETLYTDTTGNNNTAAGTHALFFNGSGTDNTASGVGALQNNSSGLGNCAYGYMSLVSNTTGSENTAIGYGADVFTAGLVNATAIGANAQVNASNKIRLGDANVTVIEGQVAYTFTSDRKQKENFEPVDGDDVLRKLRELSLTSWNYRNQDPSRFRHYGPMAQEFYAAFGHDKLGQSGDSTSINSGDEMGILMIAVQTLEKDREQTKSENEKLRSEIDALKKMVSQLLERSKPDGAVVCSVK